MFTLWEKKRLHSDGLTDHIPNRGQETMKNSPENQKEKKTDAPGHWVNKGIICMQSRKVLHTAVSGKLEAKSHDIININLKNSLMWV